MTFEVDRTVNEEKIAAMLNRFSQAITHGDGAAAARCWEVPALVVADNGSRAVATLDEVATFFGAAAAEYNRQGIASTRPEIQRTLWHTQRLVAVEVRWPYLDGEGMALPKSEASTYLLRFGVDGEPRICAVVMMGVQD